MEVLFSLFKETEKKHYGNISQKHYGTDKQKHIGCGLHIGQYVLNLCINFI